MQTQLIVGLAVVALLILWVYLRRTNKGSNLPAVSEDVNLPAVKQPTQPAPAPTAPIQETPPAVSQAEPTTPNELENKGPQQ